MTTDQGARFHDIYATKQWASHGVISGEGSRLHHCVRLVEWLNDQAAAGMRTVLDLGCGDLEWISRCEAITHGDLLYHGVDIVGSLIDHHRRIFPWFRGDACDLEALPRLEADVILLKDVLFHHCNGAAGQILMNVNAGQWRRLLVSTHPGADNQARRGLRRGAMVPLDVEATGLLSGHPSFHLPRPGGTYAVYERD